MKEKINVTIWNEYRHEKSEPQIGEIYPKGIHGALGDMLSGFDRYNVTLAALDDPEQGLPDDVFFHYDTPLTVDHEMDVLRRAGFRDVRIMQQWGESTYTVLAAV